VTFSEPWHLRSGVQFLDEVTEALYDGGAWITPDASFPDDFVAALENRLHDDRWRVASVPAAGPDKPLNRVAEVFDVSATRLALATPGLSQHVVVVDLRDARPAETASWVEFATRFAPIRREEGTGLSLCVLSRAEPPPDMRAPAWLGRIRRADAALWADMHALTDRPEPLGHLIHAISIELLGWRLDLAQSFMQVAMSDALDPLLWLARREEKPQAMASEFNGRRFECPLHLLGQQDSRQLRNRLWRAHLTAIFPWIEDQRQHLLMQFRDALTLSDLHRERFRINDVAELEVSEIARQLRDLALLPREEQGACFALGEIRKDLAHRKPAKPQDLARALEAFK
jgi:hypothetical protein